jgi:tetratricopeptide (TPR) repeat protein
MSRFSNLEFEGESGEQFRQHNEASGAGDSFAQARSAFENGNFEAALRLYSRVLEFSPGECAAWAGQVRMLTELGEFQEARLWADKALERFPTDPELLAAKAVTLARTGALDEALAFSDASIEERGEAPYLWLARGDVLLARAEQRADYCFDKALSLAPRDWCTAWLAARVRFFYNQAAHALRLLQRALELNTSHFLLWLELGRCQQALGLIGPARASLDQANQLNPHNEQVRAALAQLSKAGVWSRIRGWWLGIFRK